MSWINFEHEVKDNTIPEFDKIRDEIALYKKISNVKNQNLELIIDNYEAKYGKLLLISFPLFIISMILLLRFHDISKLNTIMELLFFISGLLTFFCFTMYIDNFSKKRLKITFRSDQKIQINRYLVDYKNTKTMIRIKKRDSKSDYFMYEYYLIISGEQTSYDIKLNNVSKDGIIQLFDNLIFE